jgi:acetyl-CoA C-acetyltransferase
LYRPAAVATIDPETPVLVGVAARSHRPEDGEVPELLDAMVEVALAAADDAGTRSLLERVAWVGVPKGAWSHPDPGRVVAERIGAGEVHTVLGEVGVLQQAVIDAAIRAVADGAPAALVVGAETAHGNTLGAAGNVIDARSGTAEPDEYLNASDLGVSAVEISAGLYDPPTVYAVLESAHAAAMGWDADEHRRRLGDLWAGFAAVAATNPVAWRTDGPDAAAILTPTPGNRMVASPYTKLCCSNIQVNQAAALLVTTAGAADSLGIGRDRWVFPHAGAVANHAVPVVQRAQLHRSPNAAAAIGHVLGLTGVAAGDLDHVDLYSCFPAAVQIGAAEAGIDPTRQLTVTGGMTFAGGPLNSYVLHSTAAVAGVLRDDPGATALVTSVSGFVTKYGAALWSTEPPPRRWAGADVTAAAAAVAGPGRADAPAEEVTGPRTVLGATVAHGRDGTRTLFAVAEVADGTRTVVRTEDDELVERGLAGVVGEEL